MFFKTETRTALPPAAHLLSLAEKTLELSI